jgi:hypothetical protein
MSASLAPKCSPSLWLVLSTGICTYMPFRSAGQKRARKRSALAGFSSLLTLLAARSYDGHVFVCLPMSYTEWPQDSSSISPAREVADAVKLAQKAAGSATKMKVTVCQGLDGEDGDILFFPPKSGVIAGPRAFRGAAKSPAGIEWFLSCVTGSPSPDSGMKCDPLD